MKKLIVPTDFSKNARNALHYAYQLADSINANITVIHAYHVPYIHSEMPSDMYSTALADAEKDTKENIESEVENVKSSFPNIKLDISTKGVMGFAVDEILNVSEEEKADYIVMGNQGSTGLADQILGSVTSSVMNRASVPVFGIPPTISFKKPEKFLFATSYNESDLKAIQKLLLLVQHFDAHLQFLHIHENGGEINSEKEEDYKKEIQNKLNFNKISFASKKAESVSEGVSRYVESHGIDVISVLKQKRGFFESLFHSSVTKKLAFHAKYPMLSFTED